MLVLKTISEQQIQLKQNHFLENIKMLHDYYVSWMFSLNMHGLNLQKIKKGKTVLNDFIKIGNESNHKTNKLWVDQGK